MTADPRGAIRHRAAELGFDLCRFTSANPPDPDHRFRQWLADGFHGEMSYLARQVEKREDLHRVLPGLRSVICLAVSYHPPPVARHPTPADALAGSSFCAPGPPASTPGPGVPGEVARYARFVDYHRVLREPLRALTAFVDRLGDDLHRSLWYADTGPVLERDLAQRAGIGFIGRHTNLISRSLGNWFLLAEILTPLEIPPDEPEPNRCGHCTRCLVACPTGAIIAPFRLDARRCLSYLTIELQGPIPVELRAALGARIFGCDDCLAACPWNRFAREGRLMKAHARPDLAEPDLLELLALDEPGFHRRFAGTPVVRAKRRGLRRNVCVALGNVGEASAQPALERTATEPDPLVAEHARWALGRIAARQARGG